MKARPKVMAGPPSPPLEVDGLTDLQVWSVPPNPRLLICHAPNLDGSNPLNLVSVCVGSNAYFRKKMRLRARRVNGRRYDLEGPLPRWPGKW